MISAPTVNAMVLIKRDFHPSVFCRRQNPPPLIGEAFSERADDIRHTFGAVDFIKNNVGAHLCVRPFFYGTGLQSLSQLR